MSQFETTLERSQATGIVRDKHGVAFIPATQRPDGTWRKAQRVKAGFVPEEDRKRYETTASRNRRLGGIPGMSARPAAASSPSLSLTSAQTKPSKEPMTKGQKKNLKKSLQRQKKRDEKAAAEIQQQYHYLADENTSIEEVTSRLVTTSLNENKKSTTETGLPVALGRENNEKDDKAKKIKNIRKKLRQIEDLENKIDSGLEPDQMQLEKIAKKEAWLEELEALEESS